jgi:periplasmic protein CpxP/Spy
MKLVRLLTAAALIAGSAAVAHAQSAQSATPQGAEQGRRGGRMIEMLFKGITLTESQRTRVDSIAAAYRGQMPAFTPGTPPSDADRAKRRELMQKEQADLRALLTADQQKTFDANVAEMRNNMQRRMGGGGPGR